VKWSGYHRQGDERIRKVLDRLLGPKMLYSMLAIATLGLLLAESIKWRPRPPL
jgi:hypothetical protein